MVLLPSSDRCFNQEPDWLKWLLFSPVGGQEECEIAPLQ